MKLTHQLSLAFLLVAVACGGVYGLGISSLRGGGKRINVEVVNQVDRGNWSALKSYSSNSRYRHIVTYTDGNRYTALSNNINQTPSVVSAYWAVAVAKGDTGATGPAGPQGERGFRGYSGAQGPTGATGATGPNSISASTATSGFTNAYCLYNNNGVVGAQACGSGTGDFSTNTTASTDGEMVLFSGTGGKTAKRSSTVPSSNGLSLISAADYAAMRTALGLAIGTNVQAYNSNLRGTGATMINTVKLNFLKEEKIKNILGITVS